MNFIGTYKIKKKSAAEVTLKRSAEFILPEITVTKMLAATKSVTQLTRMKKGNFL
jgi:hypothetical protein